MASGGSAKRVKVEQFPAQGRYGQGVAAWKRSPKSVRLDELPTESSRRLFELWKQIPARRIGQKGSRSPLEQLHNLLIRMSEHWPNYRVFDYQKDVPWTNNGTEQVIGRMKSLS